MTTPRRRSDLGALVFGAILLFVGGYYMLTNTLGFTLGEINWDAIWPLAILALGVAVVVRAFRRNETTEPHS